MQLIVGTSIALLFVVLALGGVFCRRWLLVRRGGTIDLSIRLSTMVTGRGWSMGLGRFVGDELRWYRIFSLSLRPRRVLSRRGLVVSARRAPNERELMVFPENWTIVRCRVHQESFEIAMALPTLAGFLSWVESSPPGAVVERPRWSWTS
jgi:hypothetical protein